MKLSSLKCASNSAVDLAVVRSEQHQNAGRVRANVLSMARWRWRSSMMRCNVEMLQSPRLMQRRAIGDRERGWMSALRPRHLVQETGQLDDEHCLSWSIEQRPPSRTADEHVQIGNHTIEVIVVTCHLYVQYSLSITWYGSLHHVSCGKARLNHYHCMWTSWIITHNHN